MMDIQQILALVFIGVLTLLLFLKRKKLIIQGPFPLFYFLMYKTKLGLKTMDWGAEKFRKPIQYLSYAGIIIGFIGMIFISFILVQGVFNIFLKPELTQGVALVLPFKMRGAIGVPFFYWIISIFVIAVIHEFSHGVVARTFKMKLKSSGLAFLAILVPIIPAAFVEPDEKQLSKRPVYQQLSVFAAGPFSNILLAFIVLLVFSFAFTPLMSNIYEPAGVEITKLTENGPAEIAGLAIGDTITEINNQPILTTEDFILLLGETKPEQTLSIKTKDKDLNLKLIKNPQDETKSFMGVFVKTGAKMTSSFMTTFGSAAEIIGKSLLWVGGLLYWLYLLNLGIGLFNLLPLGPIDGGRMLHSILHKYFKPKRAVKIWKNISLFFLAVILLQLGFAFFK